LGYLANGEEVKKNLIRGDVEIKIFFPLSPLLLQERVRVRSVVKFYIFYSPFKKIKKLLTMKFDFFIFPVRTGRSGFALRLIF
jgi:hypothetical protein